MVTDLLYRKKRPPGQLLILQGLPPADSINIYTMQTSDHARECRQVCTYKRHEVFSLHVQFGLTSETAFKETLKINAKLV